MVLCLVTLTDLQTRRAGLSASAELLVRRDASHRAYSLPEHLRAPDLTLTSFRHLLKTFLFTQMTLAETFYARREA